MGLKSFLVVALVFAASVVPHFSQMGVMKIALVLFVPFAALTTSLFGCNDDENAVTTIVRNETALKETCTTCRDGGNWLNCPYTCAAWIKGGAACGDSYQTACGGAFPYDLADVYAKAGAILGPTFKDLTGMDLADVVKLNISSRTISDITAITGCPCGCPCCSGNQNACSPASSSG